MRYVSLIASALLSLPLPSAAVQELQAIPIQLSCTHCPSQYKHFFQIDKATRTAAGPRASDDIRITERVRADLVLRETLRHTLRDRLPEGVSALETGFAAWGSGFILLVHSLSIREVSGTYPVGVAPAARGITYVDKDERAVIVVGEDGSVTRSGIDAPLLITEAVRNNAGWYLLGTNVRGDWEVYHEPNGPASAVRLIELRASPGQLWRLSPCGSGFILSAAQSPFTASIFNASGKLLLGTLERPSGPVLDSWFAGPLLQLDVGFVRTFTDPRSDRRVLVRYDSNGVILKEVAIDAAVGFAATNVEARAVVALRHLNGIEIVRYEWHWEPTKDVTSTERSGHNVECPET